MSIKILSLCLGLALAVSKNTAEGRDNGWTGYDLYRICDASITADQQPCLTFVAAVLGTSAYLSTITGAKVYCAPRRAMQLGQWVLIYEEWARRNPQYLNRDAE